MANNKVAPVFYSKQSSQHLPMEDGMLIDSKFIESGSLISGDAGNLITEGSDGGIRLKASDLICETGSCDNLLQTCDDGKIFVERPNIVSKQDGNLIVEDRADGSAMLGFGDAVSDDAGNLVSKGKDGKLAVMGKNLVSTDKANLIKVTDGGRLELVVDDMLSDADCNVIDIDKDGKVKLCLGMDYDLISGKMNLTGNDGAVIDSITIPSAASILESVELEKDPANIGSGYFLKLVFLVSAERKQVIYADMNSLSDIYKAGKGIELTNGYTISVKLGSNSGLEFDGNGGLKVASDVVRRPELDQYAKKSDIPTVPVLTGGDGISYTTSAKNGVTTGTIAVDLATPSSGGRILGISSTGKLSAFAQLAASKNSKTKRDCIAIADRNGDDLAEASHIDFGSGLKLEPFAAQDNDHGGVVSADLHLEAVKSGTSKLLRVVDGSGNLMGTNSVVLGAGLDVEDDGKAGRIVATATAYTLEAHAATSTKYGGGTAANYGHVRLTDSATDTHSAADSVAVSPKALESLLNRIKALEDAPAASGGFEWPIVTRFDQTGQTVGGYGKAYKGYLAVPSNAPYYAVIADINGRGEDPGTPDTPTGSHDFRMGKLVGVYEAGAEITGTVVRVNGTSSSPDGVGAFLRSVVGSWTPRPVSELARYMFMGGVSSAEPRWNHYVVHFYLAITNNDDFTSADVDSLFSVKCIPLSGGCSLGGSSDAHKAYWSTIFPSFNG